MKRQIEIHTWDCPEDGGTMIAAKLSHDDLTRAFSTELFSAVLDALSQHIAADYIEKHGTDIAAKLSPEAVENMTVAAAGAKINETLNKKMPDKILEVERTRTETQVYQRGLFGGLKRLR